MGKGAQRVGWLGSSRLYAVLLLVAVTFAVYYNSLHNAFLFDDLHTIVETQNLGKSYGGFGQFAQLYALSQGKAVYRPIRSASYAFDYAFSGLDPLGYHLSNIAYHALSAIAMFLIAEALFNRAGLALFAAILFAVHPVQTESVTYVSGRRDVLSGLFVLWGFYAFLLYRHTTRARYLAGTLLLYSLAYFSKESGIILPLLCFTYDVISRIQVRGSGVGLPSLREIWTSTRSVVRDAKLFYLPVIVLAAGLVFYVLFLMRGTWVGSYYGGSLWFTGFTMARVFVHYITLLIAPITLNADYSFNAFPVTTSWTDPNALMAVMVLIALGGGCLSMLKSRPWVAFGGIWFFVALLPVSQIIPHHEMMAEHFLYVPSAGFILATAALLAPLADRPQVASALYGIAAVILLLLSLRTVWRNADWRDDLTLWSKTVQTAPQAARARNNLGTAYLHRGQFTPAEEQLLAALRIKPDFAIAHGNLGKLYLDQGDVQRAEQQLQKAIRLKEDEVIPRLWLGVTLVRMGRMSEAEQQFRTALGRPPYDIYAYNNLGVLFAKDGRVAEAESAFQEALRLNPDLVEARQNLVRLHRLQESGEPAIKPMTGVVP